MNDQSDLFRTLAETMAAATFIYQGTHFCYVNPAATVLTEYAGDELLRMRFWDIVHPDDRDMVRERGLARQRGEPIEPRYVFRIVTRSGETRWVDFTAGAIHYGGQPAALGTAFDITEAKLAEQAQREAEDRLRRSEEHFRTVIERVGDIVHVIGIDQAARYVSPSVQRILGYPPESLVGRPVAELVHPDDRGQLFRLFHSHIGRDGATPTCELRMRHADGAWRSFEVTGDVVASHSEPVMVLTSHDVTERKLLEEQLLHSQKMEAVGRLAGGIAHDFNNLLTAIIGNADILLLDLAEADPRREDVDEIRAAADRAATLTQQLLAFGRRQVMQVQVVRLEQVLAAVDRLLRRVIGEDIELSVRAPVTLWPVRVDPRQLEQVLLNLAINSRDAMPNGGRILIEAENLVVDAEYVRTHVEMAPGAYVRLVVSDTGHGMDEATVARVFEPFFTTKEQGKGTGLGLSTVYGIVKQTGGHVRAYSEPGIGTTFKIYLPRARPDFGEPEPLPQIADDLGPAGSETVLLVEDEATVRALARRALERAGYRVIEANRGEQAVRTADEYPDRIDLLITDVLMPGINGGEVFAAVRQLRPSLRVLYISGYTDEFVVQRGLLAAGVPFLEKPFTPHVLVRRVRDVLDAPAPA